MHQQIEGIALAGEQILDAAQDQRAAMSRLRGLDLIQCQPAGADDAFVEFALGLPAAQLTGKGKTQIGHVLGRVLPVIDADQMRRLEVVSRLFERLAHHGIDQRLAFFKMPGRLIEGQTGFGFFLNQQELAVALDNSGDGDIRFPDHRDLPKAKTIILPADFG